MLTVRFHVHTPPTLKDWLEVESDKYNYRKYKAKMSTLERHKIIWRIVGLSIITLGLYIVRLKCTESGILDINNLKKKRIIHYLSTVSTEDEPIDIVKLGKGGKQREFTKETAQRQKLRVAKEKIKTQKTTQSLKKQKNNVQLLSNVLKQCMQRAEDLRSIRKDMDQILKEKRVYFLEHLFEENRQLTAALENYFLVDEGSMKDLNFIITLSPFLNEQGLENLLKKAIEASQKAKEDQKTPYHKKFEEFYHAYQQIENKADWLIVIKQTEDAELFRFACGLFAIGDTFSTKFRCLVQGNELLFDRCLQKMQMPFQVNSEIKADLQNAFDTYKKLLKQLQCNLAPQVKEDVFHGVFYTLREHFKNELSDLGLTEEFLQVLNFNWLSSLFVQAFFSRSFSKQLKDVQDFLDDPIKQQEAVDECARKIHIAKRQKLEAAKNLELIETINSTGTIRNFIVDDTLYETVSILVESEPFIKLNYKLMYDAEYFAFLRLLRRSDFYMDRNPQFQATISHYLYFHPYFGRLNDFLEITQFILKK